MASDVETPDSIHYLLMRAHLALYHRVTARVTELGLTPGQPKVLDFLQSAGEADQTTIAEGCQLDRATIGSILDRMEKGGLIVRRHHEGNRRSLFVSLTDDGRAVAARLTSVFADAERPILGALGPAEQDEFKRLLRESIDAMAAADEPSGK
ncbi:MarR family winged helix-turn-helix transcriptional regulator [Bifidobacterium choloepi]|uniref:MarR family winged helix-turn-helix transcriptional regulator n=1 Tax=Bifidobacterium choloepi TaxID=2614131 RepID=UPI0018C8823D|nr:MarR family transcriptional regulator [Bifidobacterium choloepi]